MKVRTRFWYKADYKYSQWRQKHSRSVKPCNVKTFCFKTPQDGG